MPDPDDSTHQQAQDRKLSPPDPVTGSTDHATGADRAAENRETSRRPRAAAH